MTISKKMSAAPSEIGIECEQTHNGTVLFMRTPTPDEPPERRGLRD